MNFLTFATLAVALEGIRAMPIRADFVEHRDARAVRFETGSRRG
jgi:hypothetical protein